MPGETAAVHRTWWLKGRDHVPLYCQSWTPNAPRARVVIVHGFGEHSDRYQNLVGVLARQNIELLGYDQRGHGRSGGRRGHVRRWSDYTRDLDLVVQHADSLAPALPLFVFAHSMGAIVLLDYLLGPGREFRGVVVSSPPMDPVGVSKPHLVLLARLLSPILPVLSLQLRLDRTALSRDPAIASALQADPLAHSRASVRWGAEIEATRVRVLRSASQIRVPILILQGLADRISSPAATRTFFDAVAASDKQLQELPDTYHEPHNDVNHAEVLESVTQWILQRGLPSRAFA